MKLGKLTMLSATALLAGGMSIAAAQSNMAPSESSGAAAQPQGQCWDAASNTVKDKSGSAERRQDPGWRDHRFVAVGPGQQHQGHGRHQDRPASAANLPNC